MSLVRILLVEDFDLWVHFVQARISQQVDMAIIGVASDGLEAVLKAKELQPDLILLDVDLPKLNGIDAAPQIRNVAPESAILFLSESSDPDVVLAALRAGGTGYILKSAVSRDLIAGIEAAVRGERFVSRGLIDCDD